MGWAEVEDPRGTVVPESTGILSALSLSNRTSVRTLGVLTAAPPSPDTPRMETVEDETSPAWYAWRAISSALLSVTVAGDVMPVYNDAESPPPPPPPHANRRNTASKHRTADGARFVMTLSLLRKRVVAFDCRSFSLSLPKRYRKTGTRSLIKGIGDFRGCEGACLEREQGKGRML